MKKKHLIVCFVLAFSLLPVLAELAFAQYDKDLVVGVMRANGALIGEVNRAIDGGDFFTAAVKFMDIAQNMKTLDTVTPKKGSKAEWDAINGALIKAAFRGIGACGEEDKDAVSAAVGEIGALIKKGHGIFK
jgi:hypothetical protein